MGEPAAGAMTVSDERLIQLLDAAAPEAIEVLFDRYSRLAFTLAYRLLSDRALAEDVVQEAFLSIWRTGERYRADRGSLRTWVCTIVRYRALDRLRGRSGRARLDISLDDGGTDRSDGENDGVWRTVAEEMERDQVRKAIATLSAEQRETIEMAYFSGLSQTEIADQTGLPLGTVKGRTRLALRHLRNVLDREGVEWPT